MKIDNGMSQVPESLKIMGWALRQRRKMLGLTLASVSASAGVSLGYLSQLELAAETVNSGILTLAKVCRALDVSLTYLFSRATAEAYAHAMHQSNLLAASAAEEKGPLPLL